METKRTEIEHKLMNAQQFISPITLADSTKFMQISPNYRNTFTYTTQAVNGWTPKGESIHRLGMKYDDGTNLIAIGYFRRNNDWHFHLIPCKASQQTLVNIANTCYSVAHSAVYIKKIQKELHDQLIGQYDGFVPVTLENGWYPDAPCEDDTYPEQIVNIEQLLESLEDGRRHNQVKDKLVRAQNKYIKTNKLQIEEYNPSNAKQRTDAWDIITHFFDENEKNNMSFSKPEDYKNMIDFKPQGVNRIDAIFYIEGKPAAFYCAEALPNADQIQVYANIALREYKHLSEFILVHLFERAYKNGIKLANLGGSETKNLDEFKHKFRPSETNQMYWLIYDPKRMLHNP